MQAACSVSREKCRHLHFQSRMGYYPQLTEGKDTRKGILNVIICECVPISAARVVYLQETLGNITYFIKDLKKKCINQPFYIRIDPI